MDAVDASPAIVVLTVTGVVSALYAFVCQIREERVARAAVRRVRETNPAVWQGMHWVYRRLANPTIAVRVLRARHGVSDPDFERELGVLKRLERQKLIALSAALASVALMLVGTGIWHWSWGGRAA